MVAGLFDWYLFGVFTLDARTIDPVNLQHNPP